MYEYVSCARAAAFWPGARGTRQSPPKQRYDAKLFTHTHTLARTKNKKRKSFAQENKKKREGRSNPRILTTLLPVRLPERERGGKTMQQLHLQQQRPLLGLGLGNTSVPVPMAMPVHCGRLQPPGKQAGQVHG